MSVLNKGVVSSVLFELKSWARYILPTRYVAVYYPTPDAIIHRMLKLAEVSSKDVVYDLGCGDGRVLFAAAKQYGAQGVGYELDVELVAAARHNIQRQKLQHLVEVIHGDASKADVSRATIIALYLSDRGNRDLLKACSSTLRPGTKIVSFFFEVEGWQQHLVRTDATDNLNVHLYKSPTKEDSTSK